MNEYIAVIIFIVVIMSMFLYIAHTLLIFTYMFTVFMSSIIIFAIIDIYTKRIWENENGNMV